MSNCERHTNQHSILFKTLCYENMCIMRYRSAAAHTQPSSSLKFSASQCTRERGSNTGKKCNADSSEDRKESKSREGGGQGRRDRVETC